MQLFAFDFRTAATSVRTIKFFSMKEFIARTSDFICGYPLFVLLIGGGLFLLLYSGFVPFRYFRRSIDAIRAKESDQDEGGQISSVQALCSAIAATIGMGNIAGVAIALSIGGPGAIFWMWVSTVVGMATKFFEGTLASMFRGRDSEGELQGGPMYMIVEGLGRRWKPMAVFFSVFGAIGTLCLMQPNQLVEAVDTVFLIPAGIVPTFGKHLAMGAIITAITAVVILGGIKRIAALASRLVPLMITLYFLLVMYILVRNYQTIPSVFASIFEGAFSLKAGIGGIIGIALLGARRAMLINEAGTGTASMMHGSSRNREPVREGFIAMIAPMTDSGLVCTLTSLAILCTGYTSGEGMKGLQIAIDAFGKAIPGAGQYLLLAILFIFAFSTMFSYSYYGMKCTSFLFGSRYGRYYNYLYLAILVAASVMSLPTVVGIIDIAYALMAFPTMYTLLRLAPKAKAALKKYIAEHPRNQI